MGGSHLLDTLAQDMRYALRQLRNNWLFASTAIIVLALGLCATVAIFAFVDAALIKPLPYKDPARLVGVFESIPMFAQANLSYPDYLDWKKMNTVFTALEVYQQNGFRLESNDGVQIVRGARVSDGFFRVLGVAPILGRDFYPGEDLPGVERTALLSYAAWQSRFGGGAEVLGKKVTLSGNPTIIVGVLPREFNFAPAGPAEFWTALHAAQPGTPGAGCDPRRSCHSLNGIARLKNGISLQAALANVKAIAKQLENQYPDSNRDQGGTVAALTDVVVGNIRPILLVLLGGAGLLLLIASVNVASLLLVRSEGRRKEIAVRSSLGASPGRILAQFVTEGFVLVLAGSAFGLILVTWTIRGLVRLIPANMLNRMPFWQDLGLTPRTFVFAGSIALLSAALFSFTPALHLSVSKMREGLSEGTRGSAGNAWRRLGSKLVMVELATATVLLVGAGLLGKSLYRLLQVDVGLRPDHLVMLNVGVAGALSAPSQDVIPLAHEIISRIESISSVSSVGLARMGLPLDGNGNTIWFRVLGRAWHGEHYEAPQRSVSPSYFATIGATLSRGRFFIEQDDASKPSVGIINQAMVRKYFLGEDPIGKQIIFVSLPNARPIEIVGIVNDIREGPLDAPIPPVLYRPFLQDSATDFGLVVRTSESELRFLPTLSSLIRQVNPAIVTFGGVMMNDKIRDSQSAYLHRSSAWLVGGFASLALLLGVIGLYGVIAYSVNQRTREIGIRMALGAQRTTVYRLILREAATLTAIGIAAGLLASIASATVISSLLFDVRSWDVETLSAVAAILCLAAVAASWLPARRASAVDPVEALRME